MEISLAWYPVKDLEKAKQFYGSVLGLQKVFEMDGWIEFSHAEGATSIGLGVDPLPGQANGATVVLKVEDLDQARAQLAKRGVQFEGKVEEIPGVVRLATFRDPFGNLLQLVQELVQQD